MATEQEIHRAALAFARKQKNAIAERVTDLSVYPAEKSPVSVFMAGSPGAGKTEASIALIELLTDDDRQILRIDPDDLREEFPGYDGRNSYLFHDAVSILVDRIHDLVLKQRQSFILDGTLSSYRIARINVSRSLKRDRAVQILYIYQEPGLAWEFVQARERKEGRRIRPEDFLEQYFAAREVVNRLKAEFGKTIKVDLLLKDHDGSNRLYKAGIDRIDNHVPEKYDRPSLQRLLGLS